MTKSMILKKYYGGMSCKQIAAQSDREDDYAGVFSLRHKDKIKLTKADRIEIIENIVFEDHINLKKLRQQEA